MNNPVFFQRLEGAVIFASATWAYFYFDFNWLAYILFLFAFDIFMVGYLANPRIGAFVYNLGHSLAVPLLLVVAALLAVNSFLLGLAYLWLAHIGIDRAAGYGLKFTSGFKYTHLGNIGKK